MFGASLHVHITQIRSANELKYLPPLDTRHALNWLCADNALIDVVDGDITFYACDQCADPDECDHTALNTQFKIDIHAASSTGTT